jgi:hypothetical protein
MRLLGTWSHEGAELQDLAGGESERMVRRYAHLAADHLAVCAGICGTNTAQSGKCPPGAAEGRA